MQRTAQCSCGELHITLEDDPAITLACNCTNCQRRTGSAFGVVAYYPAESVVSQSGTGQRFVGHTDSDRTIDRRFCPKCGSTVHWEAELFPGMVGVAVGCFTDPAFPVPTMAAWHKSKLDWVEFPEHWLRMPEQDASQALGIEPDDVEAA